MIGFEAYRPAANPELVPSSVYAGSDASLKVVFKTLLTKKDTVTKQKALEELAALLVAAQPASPSAAEAGGVTDAQVRDSMAHFAFLFARLVQDHDRRVRQLAGQVLCAYAQRVPRAFKNRFELFAVDALAAAHDSAAAREVLDALRAAGLAPDAALAQSTQAGLWQLVRRRAEDDAEFAQAPEIVAERVVGFDSLAGRRPRPHASPAATGRCR
jgi:hypothetical protein